MAHKTTTSRQATERKNESSAKPDLERRYGSIGIPAVAAAARYHGAREQPAPSPVARPSARRREENEA